MKCVSCRGEMTSRREAVKYDASGIPGITLNNIEVRTCGKCGERQIVIPNIEGLHTAIAEHLVHKKERLAKEEIRFLRQHLDLTGAAMAERLGVTAETVSRWEHGQLAMSEPAERLLRAIAGDPKARTILELMEALKNSLKGQPRRPLKALLELSGKDWKTRVA